MRGASASPTRRGPALRLNRRRLPAPRDSGRGSGEPAPSSSWSSASSTLRRAPRWPLGTRRAARSHGLRASLRGKVAPPLASARLPRFHRGNGPPPRQPRRRLARAIAARPLGLAGSGAFPAHADPRLIRRVLPAPRSAPTGPRLRPVWRSSTKPRSTNDDNLLPYRGSPSSPAHVRAACADRRAACPT